jgi:F-type H+-transporting ATPase subunit b
MALTASTLAVSEGEGGGGFWEDAYPIIPHPAELIIGLVAFAILYWVVKSKVVPRFEEVYSARAEAIEGGITRAERAQAQAEARRITEAAQAQIENDRQQAFQQLRGEIGRLAVDLASRIVGESLEEEARQRRTVERFLSELEAAPASDEARATSGGATAVGAGER